MGTLTATSMDGREPSLERIEEDRHKRLHPESDSDLEEIERPSKKGASQPSQDQEGWEIKGEKEKEKKARRQERKAEASALPQDQPLNNNETSNIRPRYIPPPRRAPMMTIAPRMMSQGLAFRVSPTTDWTAYEVVQALEKDKTLSLTARPGRDNIFVIYPKDEKTIWTLRNMTSLLDKPVKIQELYEPGQKPTKGVVMGYPHGLPLNLLTKEENIQSATRCKFGKEGKDTRQVLIEHVGPLPGKLDLGIWGVFYIRPYSQEPIRCYRCQELGHGISRCRNPVRCGVCSGSHETRQCIEKLKAKESVTPKCPNCQGEHHAWNKACPARLAKVDKAMEGQAKWVQTHCEAPPGTFVWGSQRSSPAPPPPSSEDFPALPLVHQAQTRTMTSPSYTYRHSAPAPPPSQPQEPALTLTATGLKSILTELVVSIVKILRSNPEAQALDSALESLVDQALQAPQKPTQATASTLQHPMTQQPTTQDQDTPPKEPTTVQAPAKSEGNMVTPAATTSIKTKKTAPALKPPQEPATVQTPVQASEKEANPDPTPLTTTSDQTEHTCTTSPMAKTKEKKHRHKPHKVCKRRMKLLRHRHECCGNS